jgi:hypothetical protein
MKPQMFADLNRLIEDYCDSEIDKYGIDFWETDNIALMMAKAAELVFDASVESSQFAAKELEAASSK